MGAFVGPTRYREFCSQDLQIDSLTTMIHRTRSRRLPSPLRTEPNNSLPRVFSELDDLFRDHVLLPLSFSADVCTPRDVRERPNRTSDVTLWKSLM
jgi:hypothetical protein